MTTFTSTTVIIRFDPDDLDFTHLIMANGSMYTLLDFPNLLKRSLRHHLAPLRTTATERLTMQVGPEGAIPCSPTALFDTERTHIQREEFGRVLYQALWWTRLMQRNVILQKDSRGKQPRKEWTCECGAVVSAEFILCANSECPSHATYIACNGGPPKHALFAPTEPLTPDTGQTVPNAQNSATKSTGKKSKKRSR